MTSRITLALLLAAAVCGSSACQSSSPGETSYAATEQAFVSSGKVEMHLDAGDYTIRAASENRIRVITSGAVATTKVDLKIEGQRATVSVKDTPHNHFQATIELPQIADVVIRLTAGNLVMEAIAGSKDIENMAGNTEIAVGDPNDYASVDASLKAGDLDAGVFGGSKSGLFPHFTWSGPGKATLRATLGAGNLTLKK